MGGREPGRRDLPGAALEGPRHARALGRSLPAGGAARSPDGGHRARDGARGRLAEVGDGGADAAGDPQRARSLAGGGPSARPAARSGASRRAHRGRPAPHAARPRHSAGTRQRAGGRRAGLRRGGACHAVVGPAPRRRPARRRALPRVARGNGAALRCGRKRRRWRPSSPPTPPRWGATWLPAATSSTSDWRASTPTARRSASGSRPSTPSSVYPRRPPTSSRPSRPSPPRSASTCWAVGPISSPRTASTWRASTSATTSRPTTRPTRSRSTAS